ncbi:hypothetical protein V1277_002763 [Bradyrhizobium sp. AZCC 1588]|uniref:DUF3306 domain-containing protein n=1 Tax=unclassified Bradyrhizobium TaxID=2631580 RepID=UPI002FF10237
MRNDTDFLARWSRRKHDAATDKIRQSRSESTPDDIVSGTSAALAQGENGLPFDPASLPTIESIGAETNIRAFLEAGVPGDLARAALRRVWSLDPAIRDFVGLSENSWDFNAPGAMAGFGPIDGEEVGRLLTRLLGEPDTIAAAVHPPVISPPAEDSQKPAGESDPIENQATNAESVALVSAKGQLFDEIDVAGDVAQQGRATAPQSELAPSECLSPILRRGHGGASPQLWCGRKGTDNSE